MTSSPDVIGLGETMLSVIAVDAPIADARTFHVTHGGAESNTCVGLSRLGVRSAWVSRLGDDQAGDRIVRALDDEHVDLRWVRRDPDRPTGLMLRDTAGAVRYYRSGSAASAIEPGDLVDVPVEEARAVLVTGITALLGEGPFEAALDLLRRARGLRVVDPNLRPGLWGSDRDVELVGALVAASDLVLGGEAELRRFVAARSPEEVATAVAELGPREVVVKMGRRGAAARGPDCGWHKRAIGEPAPDVDPVGAGDAFNAGYLAARLADANVPDALEWGTRCGAAAAATVGDAEGSPNEASEVDDGARRTTA